MDAKTVALRLAAILDNAERETAAVPTVLGKVTSISVTGTHWCVLHVSSTGSVAALLLRLTMTMAAISIIS